MQRNRPPSPQTVNVLRALAADPARWRRLGTGDWIALAAVLIICVGYLLGTSASRS